MVGKNNPSKTLEDLYESGRYISYNDLFSLELNLPKIFDIIKALVGDYSHFKKLLNQRKSIQRLQNERARREHNLNFVARQQQIAFEVEGNALDEQQIEAVVACEDAQLVMASAGSGKTLSLLAKTQYLVRKLGIPENRILTISFTKKSADELARRLSELGLLVDGKTFHALGKAILGNSAKKVYDQAAQQHALRTILDQLIRSDETFARDYNDYMLNYFTMPVPLNEQSSMKDIVLANQTFQNKTLKEISLSKSTLAPDYKTTKGDRVRSKEEQIIANYLFINNIDYEYEKPHPNYPSYHPDFTITQFGEPIYLEHQGINRDGKTRPDIDPKKYLAKVSWGCEFHHTHGAKLIQTYSYEFQEGTILTNLELQLRNFGVDIARKQEQEIAEIIRTSYKYDVEAFYKLIITYATLLKTSQYKLEDVKRKLQSVSNKYYRLRTLKFVELFSKIFQQYESLLASESAIDFSDMIVRAADTLPLINGDSYVYDYILVDEIQDLSGARYRLLKALLERNPKTKLFAVGDDWQSIYRFAGSDMSLIHRFDDNFDRHVRHSVIEQTHRFNGEILTASSDFICKNPAQTKKHPFSHVNRDTKLQIRTDAQYDSDADVVNDELVKLVAQLGAEEMSRQNILLISRYNRDIDRISGHQSFNITSRAAGEISWTYGAQTFPLKFITMHASKGLTCDHAFILNANSGKYGLPSQRENDPVLQMLLAEQDSFPDAEERRLFYVAITRAKYSTTVISDETSVSPFVNEVTAQIPEQAYGHEKCPDCEIGIIEQKKGPYGIFYGCSNYRYGCGYRAKNQKSLAQT